MDIVSAVFGFFVPWEISPAAIALCGGALALYVRGLHRTPRAHWPGIPRRIAFLAGITLIYLVMQTRFDYLSQHMFFVHRLQHLTLHHLAPFLVALSQPLAMIAAGASAGARRAATTLWRWSVTRATYAVLQNAVVAPVLFVGLIGFWLTSRVHFYAMLSSPLYWVMNWSMLIDGLLFWILILDPRTRQGGALLGFGARALIVLAAMVPQIIIGAHITFSAHDLYDVYEICGRVWSVDPLIDQRTGGLITWIPAAMMHAVAALVLIARWARADTRHAKNAGQASSSPAAGA